MILRISLILLLVGIAYLSLTPSTSISVGNDKVGHFIAYFVLMINIGLLSLKSRKTFVVGIVFAIFFGALMEVGQYFVPGRTMSIYDMLANVSGVIFGLIIILLLGKWMEKLLKSARII